MWNDNNLLNIRLRDFKFDFYYFHPPPFYSLLNPLSSLRVGYHFYPIIIERIHMKILCTGETCEVCPPLKATQALDFEGCSVTAEDLSAISSSPHNYCIRCPLPASMVTEHA